VVYIFLAAILFTCAITAAAIASRNLNTNLAAAITNLISAIIPVAVVLPILSKVNFQNQKLGILAAIVAGLFIALYAMAFAKSLSINKVAIVSPIVFGGTILLTAIVSYFLFKEKISLFQGIGLALLFLGLVFITYARWTGR